MLNRFTSKLMLLFAFRPQYMYQISAGLKHAYVSYSDFFAKYAKKERKNNKFLQKFANSYLENGLRDLLKI